MRQKGVQKGTPFKGKLLQASECRHFFLEHLSKRWNMSVPRGYPCFEHDLFWMEDPNPHQFPCFRERETPLKNAFPAWPMHFRNRNRSKLIKISSDLKLVRKIQLRSWNLKKYMILYPKVRRFFRKNICSL